MNIPFQHYLADHALCRQLMLRMMLVKEFEEATHRLFGQGLIHGTTHLCLGEEATGVGTGEALKKGDWLLATHRGHGHAIGKGADINALMAELLGKATGCSGGKGGSMHICDMENGVLGSNGIVGANGPLACGAALTIQMQHIPDRVVACFFGDGAANEGAIHESMNLAAAWKLPVLFVLTNNGYGMSTPFSEAAGDLDLTKRAIPYGMKAYECDGNDVLAVYDTVKKAREYALAHGPALIVEHTYRTCGHSKSDHNRYRTPEEIRRWEDRSPILRFRQQLLEAGTFTPSQLDSLRAEAEKTVSDAVSYAMAQPQPVLSCLEDHVYAQ